MTRKMRKNGDWIKIVKEREHKPRFIVTSRGVSNMPNTMEIGSAAYRRLHKKRVNSNQTPRLVSQS